MDNSTLSPTVPPTVSPTLQSSPSSSHSLHKHEATVGDVASAFFILLFMVTLVVGSMYFVYRRERQKNEDHQRSGGIGGVYKANDLVEQAEIEEHDFALNRIIQLELNGTDTGDNWISSSSYRMRNNTTSLSNYSILRQMKESIQEHFHCVYEKVTDHWNDGWSVVNDRQRRDSGGSSEELM